ncbi:family 3 putative glycoside hydrolase [Podospora fimiseda]|uniref:Beta-glucosidase cel3A n=1 Tax=Podospora fimiseda TaxID=252190 RepID=A0AAN7BML7_9PEZI|nr:family 3 putative glycoside hydrolase [Podospora fimiseda]
MEHLQRLLPRRSDCSNSSPTNSNPQKVLSLKQTLLSFLTTTTCIIPNDSSSPPSELPYYGLSPPVYPSPATNGTTSPEHHQAFLRAHNLTSLLTLPEKLSFIHGHPGPCVGQTPPIPRLSLPSICFGDGPSGIRGQEFVSSFPAGIHLASTFDSDLMYAYGLALGAEYRGKGINVALGPVAGPLGRIVKGGRNWEGLSPDPYLSGIGMGRVTKGIQSQGVIATVKHWIGNEQEFRRRFGQDAVDGKGNAISAGMDDRTLRELYAWPFMDALRQGGGAGGVMCSYQRVNHSYACQNSKLLNGVLKTDLGFEGFVVSDWDGQMSGVASAEAGLDLVMPGEGYWTEGKMEEAVKNGTLNEERINDMVTRVLKSWFLMGQENGFPEPQLGTNLDIREPVDVRGDHAELIREIGAKGTVVVKNEGGILPFKKPKFLCVFGYDAEIKATPWDNRDRYGGGYEVNWKWEVLNGTMITAGGSGSNTPPYVVSPFQAIQQRVSKEKGILRWDFWSENPTKYLNAEACLVFINAYASETFDRANLTDAFSDRLVLNVAAWCRNTVVVIHSAGVTLVDAFIKHPNVTAVIMAGLPGQESGNSLVDVLYGDVNPSGRLPYTIAKREEDYGKVVDPAGLGEEERKEYFPEDDFSAEGLLIDYRAFDKKGIEPRFEFGFGLSYTTFGYDGLEAKIVSDGVNRDEFPNDKVAIIQGGHPELWDVVAVVKCTVSNTGEVDGAEIAQLYVGVPGAEKEEDTPIRQLRGFNKVGPLIPGEEREVLFELTRRDLSVWDVVAQQWRMRRGKYNIWVGASSRDLRVKGVLEMGRSAFRDLK